jgi:hypothetical protein
MARVRHGVRRRPAGAAATFLLAAVVGVAGNQLTGHLSVALAAFAVLLVAGMTVTYLMERGAGGRTSDSDKAKGATSEEPGGRYDLQGAWGVQFGDHNRQVNYFGAEPEQAHRE